MSDVIAASAFGINPSLLMALTIWSYHDKSWVPQSFYCRNIKINITENRHFTLAYLLGKIRLSFIRSTEQEPSIYVTDSSPFRFMSPIHHMKTYETPANHMPIPKWPFYLGSWLAFAMCQINANTFSLSHGCSSEPDSPNPENLH